MKQKIDREKETVQLMICLYCKHIEKNAQLCESCKQLIEYAHKRLDGCRFGEKKPACNHCDVHCYKPEMRKRIRKVMRKIGPRMIWYAPKAALLHLLGR